MVIYGPSKFIFWVLGFLGLVFAGGFEGLGFRVLGLDSNTSAVRAGTTAWRHVGSKAYLESPIQLN